MSGIALYNALRKIPEISDAEAKEAVADIMGSKEVSTKSDIKDMATKSDLAELETRLIEKIADAKHTMIMWMIGIGLAIVGMIKYL